MPRKPSEPPLVCRYFTWRLFRRGGVWYADGRSGSGDLGRHSLNTRDRSEAVDRLRDLDAHTAAERGLAPRPETPSAGTLPLPEGWRAYLEHCGRPEVMGGASPRTLKRYGAVRDKHQDFCRKAGIGDWGAFDRAAAERYGAHLGRLGYAHRTIYLELTLLVSAVKWFAETGRLPAPCRFRLELRKAEGTDTFCYRREHVAAMVARCRADAALGWLADVITALACTGLRIGELASLRWSDIDLDANTLTLTDERAGARRRRLGAFRTTKSRRARSLPLHPDLRRLLESLPRRPDGRVFGGPRGGLLKPDTVRTSLVGRVIGPLKAAFPAPPGEIGFEHGRVHSFRHFFCSEAFRAGVSEAEIRQWLGHRDSRMVDHYRHLRAEDGQRKMRSIDFLGGSAGASPGDGRDGGRKTPAAGGGEEA